MKVLVSLIEFKQLQNDGLSVVVVVAAAAAAAAVVVVVVVVCNC